MRHEIKLPEFGEGITEAFVAEWLIPLGAAVAVGDELIEVMTDKANVAIEAEVAGTMAEQLVGEEDRVVVGQVLGVIESSGEPSG